MYELVFVTAFELVETHRDAGVERHTFLIVGDDNLFWRIETLTFALDDLCLCGAAGLGHIVQTKHHILRRHGDRSTVGRVEDIVGGEHQQLSLEDGSIAKGHVDCHLVTVEVGVESGTYQRVEADGLTLDEFGLECLYTESVQRRSTVQQYGMALQYILKDFPYHGVLAVDNLLGALDSLDKSALKHLADDERLEQLTGHILGQTALVHLQLGADNDDRTARVVDTLTEQVLTEAALLALQRVAEGLERAVAVALHRADLAAVVKQRVNRFLKHTFLVTHNDFRSLDFEKAFEAVVADNHAAVELVDVAGGETAAIEGNERTQVGRNDGDDVHNHPLGTVVHTAFLHTAT